MATDSKIQISALTDHGDQRGFSFTIPAEALQFLDGVEDIHVAAILPGAVRGNHFHQRRREILVFNYAGEWSFHWDEGPNTPIQRRGFQGSGAILITILPGACRAERWSSNAHADGSFLRAVRSTGLDSSKGDLGS